MALKNVESPNFENFEQIGNPRTKWHMDATLMTNHKEYYKGEGGGFPQVWAVVSLVNLCMFVIHPCTKNSPTTLTNLLFSLCKYVWIIDPLVICLSLHRAPTHPFTPKVLQVKEYTPTPFFSIVFNFEFTFESF